MSRSRIDPGSFRDIAGNVFDVDGRILRSINECARSDYEHVRDAGVVAGSVRKGYLVESQEIPADSLPDGHRNGVAYAVEHPRVPYVSYPYEWSFSQLKAAALHHLDFQLDLFEQGVCLRDASAYNVQFIGPKPIFIDLLSLAPYRQGDYWLGHRQFCEQFLNPLLLRAVLGIAHNSWYRGSLEGIQTQDLARIIPFRRRLSWNVLTQVILQARLDRNAVRNPDRATSMAKSNKKFPKSAYMGFLTQLRNWIAKLNPPGGEATVWGDYAHSNTYTDAEATAKRRFVAEFADSVKPGILFDLGCNTGDYSMAALENGAGYVVGFDFDQRAVDLAFSRAQDEKAAFLPLWLDAANPSPNQGWRQLERKGYRERCNADAMVALAFEHHLAIGRNVPLPQVVDWLVDIAPQGVIEFVPKNDPTVQMMLSLREDIFSDYTEETFRGCLTSRAEIVSELKVSESGRTLFRYARIR